MKPYRNVKRDGRTVSEHRWVWEQAFGPIPEGCLVHHKNGDKRDNRLENLELMTHGQHSRLHNDKHPRTKPCAVCGIEFTPHKTKRARAKTCSPECFRSLAGAAVGSAKGTAKLTEEDVLAIRRGWDDGDSGTDLAAEFGVSKGTISGIVNRRTWQHVPA